MQKFNILAILLLSIASQTEAQNLELALKFGGIYAPSKFKAQNVSFTESNTEPAIGYNGTFQVKKSYTKHLLLGIELGLGTYEGRKNTEMVFKQQSNRTITEIGNYQIKQYSLFLFSEYRFGKKELFYLNAGGGICKDFVSQFTNGLRFDYNNPTDPSLTDLKGISYGRDNFFGVFAGFGFHQMLTERMGLLADIRYTYLPRSTAGPNNILLSFNQINLSTGLTYRFK